MKKILFPLILVVLLSATGACLNAKLYYEYNPESVVYSEYDDTYYFAFLGKRDRSNLTDPGIVAYMDSNKELFQFYVMVYWGDDIRQATNPKGLYVVDNLLIHVNARYSSALTNWGIGSLGCQTIALDYVSHDGDSDFKYTGPDGGAYDDIMGGLLHDLTTINYYLMSGSK